MSPKVLLFIVALFPSPSGIHREPNFASFWTAGLKSLSPFSRKFLESPLSSCLSSLTVPIKPFFNKRFTSSPVFFSLNRYGLYSCQLRDSNLIVSRARSRASRKYLISDPLEELVEEGTDLIPHTESDVHDFDPLLRRCRCIFLCATRAEFFLIKGVIPLPSPSSLNNPIPGIERLATYIFFGKGRLFPASAVHAPPGIFFFLSLVPPPFSSSRKKADHFSSRRLLQTSSE